MRSWLFKSVMALVAIFAAIPTNACPPGNMLNIGSSVVAAHTHLLSIPCDDINAVPASPKNYSTTIADGHSHLVSISSAQFAEIRVGNNVLVSSTSANGHTHTFLIFDPTPIAVEEANWSMIKAVYR